MDIITNGAKNLLKAIATVLLIAMAVGTVISPANAADGVERTRTQERAVILAAVPSDMPETYDADVDGITFVMVRGD